MTLTSPVMKLALFDLDNTLLGGDSDLLWGEFLCEQGLVDERSYRQQHEEYYAEYLAGSLDISRFLEFQLRPLAGVPLPVLHERRAHYLRDKIMPVMLDQARQLVESHRGQGHLLAIITATNRFLTEPIAALFGIQHLIASEAEIRDGRYTGKTFDVPAYAAGKVTRLQAWLRARETQPEAIWFYSDSHNDLPLLRMVDHPVAVDPDQVLRAEAESKGWPVISLR